MSFTAKKNPNSVLLITGQRIHLSPRYFSKFQIKFIGRIASADTWRPHTTSMHSHRFSRISNSTLSRSALASLSLFLGCSNQCGSAQRTEHTAQVTLSSRAAPRIHTNRGRLSRVSLDIYTIYTVTIIYTLTRSLARGRCAAASIPRITGRAARANYESSVAALLRLCVVCSLRRDLWPRRWARTQESTYTLHTYCKI